MTSQKNVWRHWAHTGRDLGLDPYPIPPSDSSLTTNVEITMSDGTNLRGDIYIPIADPPFPAIIEITPYGSQTLASLGKTYASRGFLFAAIDCRGRYRSDGEWEPLTHDQADGRDVIKWMADHELCDGIVGTRGHSYSGFSQLLAAIDAPASLKAMVVGVAPGDPFYNVPFQGGCYDINDLYWLLSMTGRTAADFSEERPPSSLEPRQLLELKEQESEFNQLTDQALIAKPFANVDLRLGIMQQTFRKWLSHWQLDSYWTARSVSPHLHRTNVPTLHISGWWDGNGRGATQFFHGMRRFAKTKFARENQRLVIGPWNHDLNAPDCRYLPDLERKWIERGALRNPLNDELAWFDRYLKGYPAGPSSKARVTMYVTGANQWRDYPDWPIPDAEELKLFFAASDDKTTLEHTPSMEQKSLSYVFDPKDPTPYAPREVDGERMPFDNQVIQKQRSDLIIFTTEALQSPITMAGPVRAEIFASASTHDYDLVVSLYDQYPNGRTIYLTDGVLRARFRRGFETPELNQPGQISKLIIDMWSVGHVFRAGHRLCLQIASGAHLRFDVNSCTGGDLATETDTVEANITVYLGAKHPSCLICQLIPGEQKYRKDH